MIPIDHSLFGLGTFQGFGFGEFVGFGFRKAEVVVFFGKVCGFLVFFWGVYAKSAFEVIF